MKRRRVHRPRRSKRPTFDREFHALLAPLQAEYRRFRMSPLLPAAVVREIERGGGPQRPRRRTLAAAAAGTFLLAFLGGLLHEPLVRLLFRAGSARHATASMAAPQALPAPRVPMEPVDRNAEARLPEEDPP